MADRRKLAQGLMMMTPAMREDLASREQEIQRGKTVELLRRAGKEMYENPIVNTAIGFTPGVGDVQAAGETFAALQRGAPWQETAGYAVGMLPFVPALRTTWHGSPHGFTKFDMSKIGTGEGAQAYGHGLYLADAPQTATSYAKPTIQDIRMTPEGKMFDLNTGESIGPMQGFPKHEDLLKDKQGYLYKVELPDEQIAKMLDWDKPLSEQPESVRGIFGDLASSIAAKNNEQRLLLNQQNPKRLTHPVIGKLAQKESLAENIVGNKIYEHLVRELGGAENVSKYLNEQGIPGIQYLDQASRGAGEGTRNYVVFSDEIPQILERNGQPIAQALRDYRGSHTAPGPEFGAQLHDVTGGGAMYPEDIYSSRGASIYGHGGSDVAMDKETMRIIQQMRNKPEEMVDIYRAVPNEADISTINPGDWVTINPNYAKQHGESNLPEGYKILQQKVPAKSVWTNADSIHEYGYWPE